MVPMHARRRKEAFHEPTQPRPLPGGERAFVRAMSVPLLGGVRGGVMVPIHGMDLRGRDPAGLSLFTVGLNFQKVKCLFLSKRKTWFLLTLPIRDSQLCRRGLGSE